MKTLVSTFALSLALCAVVGASAQRRSTASTSAADSVLLSETTDGDYLVRRYKVRNQGDAAYTVRYQINLAKLAPALDGNTNQLDRLGSFVGQLMRDSMMHVQAVTITGYSSPDGPVAFNEALARKRARDFLDYVDRKYDFSDRYSVTTRSVAEDWEMCRELVVQSDIPDKQTVLNILDSSRSIEAKEQALKQLPPVWSYMKRNILPPLRRVELTIDYGEGSIVELRTRIARPAPVPAPKPAEQCCYVVVDDTTTGLIVELPIKGRDYDEYERELRREAKHSEREYLLHEKRLERAGRAEVRTLDQFSEKESREARKLARKEARVARKMAKAEAKAAKKSYKELERGMR
ncbi:MAG: hypothetical protein NC250_06110 [Alistipes senegalensis]|nr:hypothetical protein [Bacteroides cellulosilyticus]MCM1352288.1 hypothetical protein [Alistipes senegalensis]